MDCGINKYRNSPQTRVTETGAIIKFDSKAEANRFDQLMLMQKAGEIRNLKLQPQFTLQEAYTAPDGERIMAIRYIADFSYEKFSPRENEENICDWWPVVEDVKSKVTKTDVYAIKKKLMREKFGIAIKEVGKS